MNPNQTDAYRYLAQAQQARKTGDKRLARQYAEQAARLAPEIEDVWLMMGALASPRASVVFMEKALQINPQSERVRQGMHWAVERLRQEPPPSPPAVQPAPAPLQPQRRRQTVSSFLAILLTMMCLVVLASAVWVAPSMAAALIDSSIGNQSQPAWAAAQIAKPTYTPGPTQAIDAVAPTETIAPTDILLPTDTATTIPSPTTTLVETAATVADTPTPFPTSTATSAPTEEITPTPFSADPGNPTPTALPTDTAAPLATAAPQATQYVPPPASNGGNGGARWIDVDLTHQMVYVYEGNAIVNSFVVSTGTWQHPTVTGQYHVYIKYRFKDMSGPGYYLPNVPYTMFFYQGYAIHGTYWHNNFGTPMSHGCVNLSIPDSEWMYNWASVGTLVNVHY